MGKRIRTILPNARVAVTRNLDEARTWVRDDVAKHKPQVLLSGGGDGTAVALLNELRDQGVKVPVFGLLALGTGNGWARATGMPNPMLTFPQLKEDKNVADVLNYVRNSFGNKIEPPITPEFVGTVRAEFAGRDTQWTEAELLKFPPVK